MIDNVHPVTGSSTHLCLFDRFHERNTVKRKEIFRRVTHVKELKGMVNTQRDEQLHAAHRYDQGCELELEIAELELELELETQNLVGLELELENI